ncbi:MAG: tyrosine-type recombinase/integrase [Chloroflexi bacterium]|nr:tyrosine-type recombinase/integrase [Chloroflexota bacterium]
MLHIQTNTLITQSLDQNPAVIFIASKTSEHSRRTMHRALDSIAQMIDPDQDAFQLHWENLRYTHTAVIRTRLIEKGYKPASVNVMLAALRGVLKECWKLGRMTAEDYHRAADIENVKDTTLPAGRELTTGEILALFQVCNHDTDTDGQVTPMGQRDAALIAMLRTTALRRSEVVRLELADYNPMNGRLLIQGKGRKERAVYVPESARFYLDHWLSMRGDASGPLLSVIRKGGHITLNALTPQSVYDILEKRATQAGVKDFSPHDFRRTFAGDMLDRGADIVIVAGIMGHADVNTTRRYDRRPDEAKRKAADLITVPLPK